MAVLSVEGVRQVYQSPAGETVALQDISFTMEKGDFFSLVGPSGCGKSTLLSIIAGTLRDVGSGKLPPGALKRAIDTGDRLDLGITAPAHGLTLMEVFYEPPREAFYP